MCRNMLWLFKRGPLVHKARIGISCMNTIHRYSAIDPSIHTAFWLNTNFQSFHSSNTHLLRSKKLQNQRKGKHIRSKKKRKKVKGEEKEREEMRMKEQEEIENEKEEEEEEKRRKETEEFHEMVKQLIAQMETHNVTAQMLEVPAPKRQDYKSLKDFIVAWHHFIIYEIKWRTKDIYYEFTLSLPYPPGYTPPKPEPWKPLKVYIIAWKYVAKDMFAYYKHLLGMGPPPVSIFGEEEVKRYEEKQRLKELEKRGFVEVEEEEPEVEEGKQKVTMKKVKKVQRKKTISDTFKESSNASEFVSNVLKTRFLLLRNCLNQFIIGYNEGMGREIDREALLKRKSMLSEPMKIDKETIMQKVGTVARGLRGFTEDIKQIITVDEKDIDAANIEQPPSAESLAQKSKKKLKKKSK